MKAAALLGMVVACSSPATPDAPSPPWTEGPPVPAPRLEPGVTALGSRLVVVGGFDTALAAGAEEITTRVDVFDPLDTTGMPWSRLHDAPVAWTHIQLAAVGTTLYLLGGLESQAFVAHGEAWKLDTQDPAADWVSIASIPASLGLERGSAAVIVAAPRIFLLGGSSSTGALATNLYYDTDQDGWCPGTACPAGTQLPDLMQPRSHPAGMRRVDGTLVVAGGLATLDSTSQAGDTWQLGPGDTSWQTKAPMPANQERGGCAYGVLQGQLVCAGGEAGTSALSSVLLYDPLGDTWRMGPPMLAPRAGTQGAAIGQRLFVPGGAERLAFEPTASLYIFSPLDTVAGP